jgi:hypothetical protein
MQIPQKSVRRCLACLAVAALALPNTGCIAAAVTGAVVGAGAAGYAYYQGAVPRDYPANIDLTWAAAQQAVTDLGMPLDLVVRDNDGGTIETRTGDGDKVQMRVEPRTSRVQADGQWTNVSVRVAWFGDSKVSDRLLNQIDLHLPHAPEPAASPARIEPVPQTVPPPMAH